MPRKRRSDPRICSGGSAGPTRSRRARRSCCPPMHPSSPAPTCWSTAAIPLADLLHCTSGISMTLLITGGTGFVMSVVSREWLERHPERRAVILDRAGLDATAAAYFEPVRERLSVIQGHVPHPSASPPHPHPPPLPHAPPPP